MNIEPALVGKVAAAVRSERLKHTEPSDAVLALAAIRAIFDWQPIETAPKDGSWFLSIGNHGSALPISTKRDEFGWVDEYFSLMEPTHWLPMIPLPEVV